MINGGTLGLDPFVLLANMSRQRSGSGGVTLPARKELASQRRIRNILLVEDDADTRHIIQESLSEEGYFVRSAVDRDEAVQHLRRALFQVILMDLCMPGLSAEQFVNFVRDSNPGSQIVVVTAAQNVENAARTLGLKYSLGKPLTMDSLLDLLDRLEKSSK